MRVASLGMYDLPAIAAANDALWGAIAARLRAAGVEDVPDALDRGRPLGAIWDDPALLLAQTCGAPFAGRWRGRLRYVATPCYAAPGCEDATYSSVLVARPGDEIGTIDGFRGRIAAINERASNSGHHLFRSAVAPLARGRFFGSVIETGSHLASAEAVAAGAADIAAIDAVTFAHLRRHCAALTDRLCTVARSAPSPGLPLVTAASASDTLVGRLREAIGDAFADDATRDARKRLLIDGVAILPDDAYDVIPALAEADARADYPQLA